MRNEPSSAPAGRSLLEPRRIRGEAEEMSDWDGAQPPRASGTKTRQRVGVTWIMAAVVRGTALSPGPAGGPRDAAEHRDVDALLPEDS